MAFFKPSRGAGFRRSAECKSKMLKDVGKDAFLYIPARFFPPVITIAGIAIFTRILAPKDYGQYILVINSLTFAIIFFYEWLGSSALRYYEESKLDKKLHIYASTLLCLYIFVSIILSILAILSYYGLKVFTREIGSIYWIALVILLLKAYFSVNLNIIRASRGIIKYDIFTILESCLKIGFAVAAVTLLSLKVEGILGGYCTAYILISSSLLIIFFKRFNISIRHFSVSLSRSFIIYGFPLVGTSICGWILSLADRYIIQLLKGTELVGIYAAGYQIAGNAIQVPSFLLMLAAFPIIIQVYERGEPEETGRFLTKLTSIFIIITIPLVLIVSLFSKPIVGIVLGSEFNRASAVLPLVSLGQFCMSLSPFLHKGFELKKKTYKMLYFLVIAAVTNVVLNFLFIPSMNEVGAALATLLSYFAYLIFLRIYGRGMLVWKFPYLTLLKCLSAAGVCFFIFSITQIVILIENYLLLASMVILTLLVYIVILWAMREDIVLGFIHAVLKKS